jgi:hypothetical protein
MLYKNTIKAAGTVLLSAAAMMLLFAAPLHAGRINYAAGFCTGITPSMGGNLHSWAQEEYFNTKTGVDGIGKTMDGFRSDNIRRLLGVSNGLEFKAIFFDYFFTRLGANFVISSWGGKGDTVFDDGGTPRALKCTYTMMECDLPLTVGLSLPFWKDIKISFSFGAAFAYAWYRNTFEGPGFKKEGVFSGYAFPLVILVESEYFITEKISISASLAYYHGATGTIRDGQTDDNDPLGTLDAAGTVSAVDQASIDLSGYRFSFGVSYYFYSI